MHNTTLHNNTILHKTTQDYTRLHKTTHNIYSVVVAVSGATGATVFKACFFTSNIVLFP